MANPTARTLKDLVDLCNFVFSGTTHDNEPALVAARLAVLNSATPEGAQGAVAWERREDRMLSGEFCEWEPISKADYDIIAKIIGSRPSARIARTSHDDATPAERNDGWPTQVRALYTQPASDVVEAARRGLIIDQLESDLTQATLGDGSDIWEKPKVRGQPRQRNRLPELVQDAISKLRAIDAARGGENKNG